MAVPLRHTLIALMVLLLGACASPPPRLAAPPPPVLDPDAACLKDLRDMHVAFEPQAPFGQPGSCSVANPVKVSQGGQMGMNRPGVMSCAMARSVERFEQQVVQPLARKILGQPIARLQHMGTYDCRARRTEAAKASTGGESGSKGGRLSEHGKGQAIDIGGFELADGSVISVKKDWRNAGKKSDFLQQLARASCEHFTVVLTPNHNRLHNDHLHLDIGPHRLCGV